MDRQSSWQFRLRRTEVPTLLSGLAPGLTIVLVILQSLTALVLCQRRVAGAIVPSAAPGWLLVGISISALLAIAVRYAWLAGRDRHGEAGARAIILLPLGALLSTAAALTSWNASILLTFVVGLVIAGEELFSLSLLSGSTEVFSRAGAGPLGRWSRLLRGRSALPNDRRRQVELRSPHGEPILGVGNARLLQEGGETHWKLAQDEQDRDSQRVERVKSADGADRLVGWLTKCLLPGETTVHIHVAFCPPFALVPELEYRQTAGPTARIRVGQLLPHGVRFDVKLAAPAVDPVRVALELRAIDREQPGAASGRGGE